MAGPTLTGRYLGLCEYAPVFQAMKDFTDLRQSETSDEIWALQHPPVYTLGRAARQDNLLNVGSIPVVQIDRGGDVTYHGPGQLVVYLMASLPRLDLNIRQLVTAMEQSVVELLRSFGVESAPRADAPGVYVGQAKIASLGLRVRRGATYHGLALNLDMDMQPWAGINACDLGVPVTQLADLTSTALDCETIAHQLVQTLAHKLGYQQIDWIGDQNHPAQMPTFDRQTENHAGSN